MVSSQKDSHYSTENQKTNNHSPEPSKNKDK